MTDFEKINAPEQFSQGTEWKEDMDDLLTKCGEVFMQHRQQQEIFVIGCTLCDGKFLRLDRFIEHINDSHLIEENSELWDEDEKDELEWEVKDEIKDEDLDEDEVAGIDDIQLQLKQEIQEKSEEDTDSVEQIFIKEDFSNIAESSETTLLELELLHEDFADNESNENIPENESQPEEEPDDSSEYREPKSRKREYRCNDCGQEFKRARELRQHKCTSWEPDKNVHQCTKCGKCFNRKSNLKTHELIHKTVRPFPCDICGASFANKQNFVIHLRRHSGEKPFKCSYCEKAFVSSTERHTHERSHTGSRPYVCEICGKNYTTSSRLLEHVNRHADLRRYSCSACDKKFRTGTHLRSHFAVVHTDLPRIYDCTHCTASFKTSQSLRQHSKIHSEVKSYKCRVCSKEFAQHAGVYAHMKTHNK